LVPLLIAGSWDDFLFTTSPRHILSLLILPEESTSYLLDLPSVWVCAPRRSFEHFLQVLSPPLLPRSSGDTSDSPSLGRPAWGQDDIPRYVIDFASRRYQSFFNATFLLNTFAFVCVPDDIPRAYNSFASLFVRPIRFFLALF